MLPWAEMLRAALMMGIRPAEFWRLSLREWRWLTGPSGQALTRTQLETMLVAHPDKKGKRDE
ncbi:phage tail assembly chaperone [Henriciella sp. AS95]|uniref:phage tail assembly chaperone n=1 Tax=Henriciella sp. AS95 TaxID=3135782 RepID=UPI00319E9113